MKKLKQQFEKKFVIKATNYHGFRMVDPGDVWKFIENALVKRTGDIISDILPRLHRLRANIPLTSGKFARVQVNELISYLEKTAGH